MPVASSRHHQHRWAQRQTYTCGVFSVLDVIVKGCWRESSQDLSQLSHHSLELYPLTSQNQKLCVVSEFNDELIFIKLAKVWYIN